MSEFIPRVSDWLIHTLAVGGALLLVAAVAVAVVRQPVRRKQIALWGLRVALLAPLLTLAPSWIRISVPAKVVAEKQIAEAALSTPTIPDTPENSPHPSPLPKAGGEGAGGANPLARKFMGNGAGIAVATFPGGVAGTNGPFQGGRAATITSIPDPVSSGPLSPGFAGERVGVKGDSPAVAASRSPFSGFSLTEVVLGMFLAASALFAIRWMIAHLAVMRIVAGSRHGSGKVARLFSEQSSDFAEPPRLLVSDRITIPICFGMWRPTVLLPVALVESADENTLRWVIVHELAHLRNGDPWTALVFGIAQTIYFPVPWFWWLKRRVALCQEFVADAAAASLNGRPEDYAECLLNLSRAAVPSRFALAATGVLGRPSDLYRRISTLLKEKDSMKRRTSLAERLLTAGILLAFGIGLAGIGLQHPSAAAAKDEPQKKEEPQKDELNKPAAPAPEDINKRMQRIQDDFAQLQKKFDEMQKRMQERGLGGPNDFTDRIRQAHEENQKQMDAAPKRGALMIGPNMVPGMQLQPGFGGFNALNRGRPRLGAAIDRPSAAMVDQLDLPKDQGLVIGDITPEGAAAKAGLKPHDILLEIGGKAVSSDPNEFRKQLGEIKANTPVDAVVLRKGKKETIKGINLPEAKPEQPGFNFGGNIEFVPGVQIIEGPVVDGIPLPQVGVAPGVNVNTMQVQVNDGHFTIHSNADDRNITIAGTLDDGAAKVESVKITDGKEKVTADSLEKVPAKYKDEVQKLLKSVGGSKK